MKWYKHASLDSILHGINLHRERHPAKTCILQSLIQSNLAEYHHLCIFMFYFPAETKVIIILASVLGGMVLLFLLVGIIVCLWVAKKRKVGKAEGRVITSSDAVMQRPVTNTYYDSVNRVSTRSTSAVYDTVRREELPEIVLTGSQGTIAEGIDNSSLGPLQASPRSTSEPPYDNTNTITGAALQLPNEGGPLPDAKLRSPYYSYVENGRGRVQLEQQKEGASQQNDWVAVVKDGRRAVPSWTGSEHVYI